MPHVVKTPAPLDLNDIQGDILDGLPKKSETFFFFHINETRTQQFRTQLTEFIPLITTSAQCQDDRYKITEEKRKAERNHTTPALLEISAVNIAFSQKGLNQLSINDDIGDSAFKAGMQADAQDLGDDLTKWDEKFKQEIHGVILITGSTHHKTQETLARVKGIFSVGHHHGATIKEVLHLDGHSRPGKFDGHEHFGFNDGISQPAIDGLKSIAHRGQETVNQGVIFIGREGDNGVVEVGKPPAGVKRPTWAQDGSFLCFRYLQQLVPEFNKFLEDNALPVPEPRAPEDPSGSELLGARLVGRWKSGAPVDITPIRDDPSLSQSDAFRYDPTSQERCPFAAHTRKMNPRSDLDSFGGTEVRRIIRRGIQFGPEVTDSEAASHKSSTHAGLERGLLFVCYQSNIVNGFQFLQHSWANQPTFPPKQDVPKPGFDPIIGIGKDRELVGTNPKVATMELSLQQDWVVPRGGEYFFSPSISALRNTFALRETFVEAA